ncbi:PRC-barrel domain-containing protein [Clostridium aciditolerans]|uniref:PRC-barrel domain-containing protein n=1 Tax=Clostridium aciditolerans TaxID=339861 RepID=A0A934I0T4_9CLOT|nr:PRC-barrel domain-containing protein [Clostridium aciditolerans]MBI6873940.1 PRC-barrel domain-containing protein [Clostridium aciditolerans]
MYRTRDFMLMDVISVNGKKLGFINDILIDFNKKKVVGFSISSTSLLRKNLNVMTECIVGFNSVMVTTETFKGKFLEFKDIKGMDVKDRRGNIIGMIEDILFDEDSFIIGAVIISTGFITNFISGKKIILINNLVLGEKNMLYNERNANLNFTSLPHKLFMEDDVNEKNRKKDTL